MDDKAPTPHPLAEDFPWQRLASPVLTGSQLADKGSRALRRLRECGITLPEGNRLERVTQTLGRTLGQSLSGHEIAGEAARTVLDFYLFTHAQEEPLPPETAEKVVKAVTGGDTPASDGDRGARDTQFELVVWGLLRIGGFKTWFEEPPDLVTAIGGEELGVAVKRVWSLDQAHKRLSLAAKQIASSRRRGIIATNVQEYLSTNALGSNQSDVGQKGRAFDVDVQRMHGQMAYLAKKPHLFGLLLTGTGFVGRANRADGKRPIDLTTFTQFWGLAGDTVPGEMAAAFEGMGGALRRWYRERL